MFYLNNNPIKFREIIYGSLYIYIYIYILHNNDELIPICYTPIDTIHVEQSISYKNIDWYLYNN